MLLRFYFLGFLLSSACLSTFSPSFSLPVFFRGHVVAVFSMVRAQGWSYGAGRSAWSRSALSRIRIAAALCVAYRVSVSLIFMVVNSYVFVRIFHISVHGAGPYCLGSLQSCSLPWRLYDAPGLAVPLLLRSWHREAIDSSVIDTAPRREYPEWSNGIKCESIFAIQFMSGTIPLPFNS